MTITLRPSPFNYSIIILRCLFVHHITYSFLNSNQPANVLHSYRAFLAFYFAHNLKCILIIALLKLTPVIASNTHFKTKNTFLSVCAPHRHGNSTLFVFVCWFHATDDMPSRRLFIIVLALFSVVVSKFWAA